MNECNSIEAIDRTNLTEQTKIRLNKTTEIENVFHQEISQRKLCSKKLSKYVTAFDYIKFFIALSAATGGVFICSFTSIAGAPVGISSASFTLIVPLTTGIAKKLLLNITRNKKKHDEILMLAKKLVKKNSE